MFALISMKSSFSGVLLQIEESMDCWEIAFFSISMIKKSMSQAFNKGIIVHFLYTWELAEKSQETDH